MEVAHGGELSGLIRNQKVSNENKGIMNMALNSDLVRAFSSEIILAISYIHSQGIIHRDLKVRFVILISNLFIDYIYLLIDYISYIA